MERLGMRREARFEHSVLMKGEWADELVYAILDHEWKGASDLRRASGRSRVRQRPG